MRLLLLLAASAVAWSTTTGAQATSPVITFEVLHRFAPNERPAGPLVMGDEGVLFGMTQRIGDSSAGTIFSIDRAGTFRVLNLFPEGSPPTGRLVRTEDGQFYGVTEPGSTSGTIFRLDSKGAFSTLYSFKEFPAGGSPLHGLTIGSDGYLYGTADGVASAGSVFRLDAKGRVTVVHAFASDGSEGAHPSSVLIEGRDDHYYGTTSSGGAFHSGTIFRVSPEGEADVVHSFDPNTEARGPTGGLTVGIDGQFYGVTCHSASSGSGGGGVYRIGGGKTEMLHTFTGAEGSCPIGELVLFNDGKLIGDGYLVGVTRSGGPGGAGTVYRIDRQRRVLVLHAFGEDRGGSSPAAGLIQGADGALYGTTEGSPSSPGVVFRVTADKRSQ